MLIFLFRQGYQVFYDKLIEMPSNFVIKYDAAKIKRILDKANKTIPHIAEDIVTCTSYSLKKSLGSKVFSFIGKAEWYGAHVIGKFFYVKSDCIRCGKCMDNCPNQNIVMDEKYIFFKWNCCICMRCVYHCPKNAIRLHQPFGFIRFDKWYDLKAYVKVETDQK
jgi:ferredoxin